MSATNCQQDCPICMDTIEMNKNCVTTECGHCFHASCLMANVAHNGFGCPYCRTAMAEEPEEEEEEEISEWGSDDESEDQDEMFNDFTLRGFRFFMNNLNNEEHNADDVEREADMEEETQEQTDNVVKPSAAFITQKLVEQGVTMESLIKAMLINHDEYDAEEEEYMRIDDDLFGKLRIIISNYRPEPEAVAPEPVEETIPATELDDSAQPKERTNVTFRQRRLNTHL